MNIDLLLTAIGGIVATIATLVMSNKKSKTDSLSSKRDDFTVIVDKFKEIIEYREAQIGQQQAQIETLIKENNAMKRRMKQMIDNYEEMKDILNHISIDPEIYEKIDKIYKEVIAQS